MNFFDILILLAVAAAVILGFVRTRRRKRSGKTCCSYTCGNCDLCRDKPGMTK